MEKEEKFFIYNELSEHFINEGFCKKLPSIEKAFCDYYLSKDLKEKEIISNLFCKISAIPGGRGTCFVSYFMLNSCCGNDTAEFSNASSKLQFTFFILSLIDKFFNISKNRKKYFFDLMEYYTKYNKIIIWKQAKTKKFYKVITLTLSKRFTNEIEYLPKKELNYCTPKYLKIFTLKKSDKGKTDCNFVYRNKEVVGFNAKNRTLEEIKENYEILYNFFPDRPVFIEDKNHPIENCPWCNPDKKIKGKDTKCYRCREAMQILIELNKVYGKYFKKDRYISEYILRYLRSKKRKNDKLVQRAIEAAIEKMVGEHEIVCKDTRQINKHYSLGSAYNKAKNEITRIYIS